MKSLKLPIFFLSCCIALASCDSEEVAPADDIMSQELSQEASSGAETTHYNATLNLGEPGLTLVLSCDESILMATKGTLRIGITTVINHNRAVLHLTGNISNLVFTDVKTGERYVGAWVFNRTDHYIMPALYPYHSINKIRIVLTTPGKENNVMFKTDLHTKLDAEGNLIVYRDNDSAECYK